MTGLLTVHTEAIFWVSIRAKEGMTKQTLHKPEKLISEASEVATLRNSRHLELLDPKSTAAWENIPSEEAFVKQDAF